MKENKKVIKMKNIILREKMCEKCGRKRQKWENKGLCISCELEL